MSCFLARKYPSGNVAVGYEEKLEIERGVKLAEEFLAPQGRAKKEPHHNMNFSLI